MADGTLLVKLMNISLCFGLTSQIKFASIKILIRNGQFTDYQYSDKTYQTKHAEREEIYNGYNYRRRHNL